MWRRVIACALVGACLAAPARAAGRNGEAEDLIGGFLAGAATPGVAPPADAPYPHIYQGPLFGALFAVSNNETAVDESALRYYASLHNFGRANAEIKRLKALHPNWTPPTNIYSAAGAGADEQPFWDLLAADRLEELRAGIALKERKQPGWKPSRDLTTKIARKVAIAELARKSDEKKPAEALAVADADPSILHCAYMDADWRVADAFLDVGLPKRAFEIYHAIIATCPDHDERLATVRKSISRFAFEDTASLIAMGAKSADGATEFDAAKIDLTRARLAALNEGKVSTPIAPEALADYFAEVARSRAPADLALSGWYEYNHGAYDKAERWFALAKLGAPAHADATAINLAEGHALSYLKLGRVEEALSLAYLWRDASKSLRETYAGAGAALLTRTPPPQVADQTVADFSAFVESERHFVGAEALGWWRYNRGEWEDAAAWFKTALIWKGVDPSTRPAEIAPEIALALEGYGRALARSGRIDEATRIADLWRGGGPSLETLFVDLMSAAVDAATAASALDRDLLAHYVEATAARQSVAGARGLGWLAYRSADYSQAIGQFRRAMSWGQGRSDAGSAQGLALALKQTGELAEAEEIAWDYVRESQDMRAIYVSVVVAQLAADKPNLTARRLDRFVTLVAADRSAAGAQALGWYRLKAGNCAYAAPWFRRATAWSAARNEDAETARGLALSLKAVGAYAQAEDAAYAWRDRDAALRGLYVDIAIAAMTSEAPAVAVNEARAARLARAVIEDHHVRGARALGWFRYRQAACGFGGDWLRLAVAWGDADKRDAKTDEGLGLSLRATGRLTEAASLAWPWVDQAPLMKKLYVDVMVEQLSRDNPPEPVDEARLKEFVSVIAPMPSPLGAQALGWYRLERKEYAEAGRWFKQALDWWPAQRRDLSQKLSAPVDDYQPILAKLALIPEDYRRTPRAYPNSSALIGKSREAYVNTLEGLAKTEEGYVQSLRALGRLEEAEAIAWEWRDRAPSLRSLFVNLAVDALSAKDAGKLSDERLARYASAIEEARSAPAASAFAWRALNAHAADVAAAWFAKALRWSSEDPPDAGLVQGYVAALQAEQKFVEADALAARYRGRSPRFDLIYLQSELQALRASGKASAGGAKYDGIAAEIAKTHSPEGAQSLGWLAYETKDFAHALDWFGRARAWGGDRDKADEGTALSLRALGRFEELAQFGYEARANPAVREVWLGGLIGWMGDDKSVIPAPVRQQFEAAVTEARHVAGAGALGWNALKRGQGAAARRWFENALAWNGLDALKPPEKPEGDQLKLVEGYVQALRASGDVARAEDVSYAWRGAAPLIGGLYLQIVTQQIGEDTPAPRLARFAEFAQAARSVEAAGALGWRFYRAKAAAEAIVWFERALNWSPEGAPPKKIAEGYTLSLRLAGRARDAEDFAYPLSGDADLRALYISAVVAELADKSDVSGQRLDRFVGVVGAARSAQGARALGWRRLAQDNCVYAAPWFRKAAAWSADSGEDADTARGLALALQKAGALPEAESLAYVWRERAPEMDKAFVDIGVQELTSEAPVYKMSEARVRRVSERTLALHHVQGARALGWWRYRQAACGFGGEWLRLAIAWNEADKRDAKTDEGLGLTLRATGRLTEAASLAYPWAAQVPLMKKLYIDVMVEELSRDNPPQPVDEARLRDFAATITPVHSALGAQALGWYRLERGELDEAARWFKQALDWWPAQRRDKSKRLSAPVDDYKPILAKLALIPEDYRRTPRAYPNSSALIGKASEDYVNTEQGLAKTQEGYAQTLRALGRLEEAEAIAWSWRDRWPSLRALYLDIAVAALNGAEAPAPERMRRFIESIEADRSAAGAAALAWRHYRAQAFDAATGWFEKALAWTQGDPAPSLIEGYVLSLQGAKKYEQAEAVAAKGRARSPSLNLLYVRSVLERLRAAGKSTEIAPEELARLEKSMSEAKSADGLASLAWIAYDAHDYAHALEWFREALALADKEGAAKAKEGMALSLRALERFEELAAFGFAERGVSRELRATYVGGMVAWLTSDKPLREVKPEARADFETAANEDHGVVAAQALAWGSLMRGQASDARRWFETALDWSGVDPLDAKAPRDAARVKLIEGYAQALKASGDLARGEDVAYVWRAASPALGGLYLQIVTQELAGEAALAPERVARFAAVAEAQRAPQAAGALGWRAYRAKDLPLALAWFTKAMDWSPGREGDAKIDEGYALTLRASGRLVEAEDFAYAHRALSREMREAYVAAFSDQLLDAKLSTKLSPERLARFGQIVESDRIGAGAAALGWKRLQEPRCFYALGWFRKAIAWSKRGAGDDKLYSGYAQAARALGLFHEAEDAAFTHADQSAESRALYQNIVIEELTRQWPRVTMDETRIGRFTSVVVADRSAAGAQALGWKRYMQAGGGYGGRWFEMAALWSADQRGDAHLNEGYALSLSAVGRLARAEEIARPWIERAAAMKKLYIDIAVEELSRDYPPAPLPEERVAAFDAAFASVHSALGEQALGWYRFSRGEYALAARAFTQALDWWPPLAADADQKLSAPVDDYHAILARLALRPEDYRRTPRAYPNSSLLIGHDTESYVKTTAGLAKTIEGYVRTLAAIGRYEEAENLAFRWLDRWPPLRAVLIEMAAAQAVGPAPISPERLARLAALIEADRSAAGAEALGWRAYRAKDYAAGARWLKAALDWRAAESKPSLDVARAYADSLRALKRYDEALAFVALWRERLPGLESVALDIGLDSLGALDPDAPETQARVRTLAEQVAAAKSASGALSLGWLAYNHKEFAGAEAWFKKAIQWTPAGGSADAKALEGLARALQGEQRYADFLRFTQQWSQREASLKPLYLQAAAQAFGAAAAAGEDVATDTLAQAGKVFAEAKSADGAQALAWQRLARKDFVAAEAWFRAAQGWAKQEDPKNTEGLVIALRNLRRDDEAEALAFQAAQRDEGSRGLYLEVVAERLTRKPPEAPDAPRLRRFAEAVLAARSANGAQALGWYSFNARQYEAAAAWFEKALSFGPTESAALGAALAYRRRADRDNYARIVETYGETYAKVGDLGGLHGRRRERRAAAEEGEARAHWRASLIETATPRPAAATQGALGWRLLNQNRPAEAARAFEASLQGAGGRQRQDAAYGRALALLATGQTTDASRAAAAADLTARQRAEIGVQLLTRRAWDAYNADRYSEALMWLDRRAAYTGESRDLVQMRMWCLQKLGRLEAASAIQSDLDRQLSP